MKITDQNIIDEILYPFSGLSDDNSELEKFYNFDRNNYHDLVRVIELYILPNLVNINESDVARSISLYRQLATEPKNRQISRWNSILPPFDYPDEINLFEMITTMMERHHASS